ncbi:hypothetical protein ACFL6E_03685 [Candidatus Neomarinimicrobiota bacterium]
MKRIIIRIAAGYFLLGIIGCDATEPVNDSEFAIYFLADEHIIVSEALEQGIDSVVLEREPRLSAPDLEFYDFSSHCIYMKQGKNEIFHYIDAERSQLFYISMPFVVVAGNTRCYIGTFYVNASSSAPIGPYMDELDWWQYPEDVLHLSPALGAEEDVRGIDPIRENLAELDLFHSGLKIRLDSASVIGDSSIGTVQYTFTMTNNDADDLLVLDPDLMGSAQFHYFTNGVTFNYAAGHYWAENKELITPEPFDSWEPEWFIRIEAGESIQRTVQLAGYSVIPAGTYDCTLKFSNPRKIALADRKLDGARYWLGEITADDIVVVVD